MIKGILFFFIVFGIVGSFMYFAKTAKAAQLVEFFKVMLFVGACLLTTLVICVMVMLSN